MRKETVILAGVLALGGCLDSASIVVTRPEGRSVEEIQLEPWLGGHALEAGEEVRMDELGQSEFASFHIVQIRAKEPLHVHRDHDLTAIIRLGKGTLTLGGKKIRLQPGSIVNIPRGIPHAFVNESSGTAVAYVVSSPPFDGTDSVPVESSP